MALTFLPEGMQLGIRNFAWAPNYQKYVDYEYSGTLPSTLCYIWVDKVEKLQTLTFDFDVTGHLERNLERHLMGHLLDNLVGLTGNPERQFVGHLAGFLLLSL